MKRRVKVASLVPAFGGVALIVGGFLEPVSVPLMVVGVLVAVASCVAVDVVFFAAWRYHRTAVDLVRQWPAADRADALDWVPDEILAAAHPAPQTDAEAGR